GPVVERPSHRPTLDGEGDLSEAGTRLEKFRELTRDKGAGSLTLTPEMLQLAKTLLKDPKLFESVKSPLKPADLGRPREKSARGEGTRNAPAVKNLLKEGADGGALSPEQQESIRKWMQGQKTGGDSSSSDGKSDERHGEGGDKPAGADEPPGWRGGA